MFLNSLSIPESLLWSSLSNKKGIVQLHEKTMMKKYARYDPLTRKEKSVGKIIQQPDPKRLKTDGSLKKGWI